MGADEALGCSARSIGTAKDSGLSRWSDWAAVVLIHFDSAPAGSCYLGWDDSTLISASLASSRDDQEANE